VAVLENPSNAEPVFLSARHLFGRSPGVNTQISSPEVSGEHAVFLWTGERWELRDLGSKNGTWVGDTQLGPGERKVVAAGDAVAFGDPASQWILRSDGEPTVAAWTEGLVLEGEGQLLVLPNDDDPQAIIELDPVHGWQLIRDGKSSPVAHGDAVTIDGGTYRVSVPGVLAPVPMTAEMQDVSITENTIRRVGLEFAVSSDEEYIELTATVGDTPRRMAPRVHHYLLLVLARARLTDAADGVVESEQGWVYTTDLRRDLRITANQYYVMSHRLRREVEDLGVVDAVRLLEKRTTSRQVRIGVARLAVHSI